MLDRAPAPYRVALTMARKSEYVPYRIGACLARGRRIISAGYNQIKTHPLTLRLHNKFISGLHAEMHTCAGVDEKSLRGADIYVVRLRRDGGLGMARPCKECQRFLKELGIRKAYYTETGGGLGMLKI
ncbi:MAG: hypothetical protein GF334_02455 [Candidatus Altiarchaeales archaeon]|nr:hypothetical protein [Candidatus Altiarchaeales archaeon]